MNPNMQERGYNIFRGRLSMELAVNDDYAVNWHLHMNATQGDEFQGEVITFDIISNTIVFSYPFAFFYKAYMFAFEMFRVWQKWV